MPKFEACSRIRKRLVTIIIFSYFCFDLRCAGETQTLRHQRNVWENLNCDQKLLDAGFRMRLHASNFGIQILSRNIRVFNS